MNDVFVACKCKVARSIENNDSWSWFLKDRHQIWNLGYSGSSPDHDQHRILTKNCDKLRIIQKKRPWPVSWYIHIRIHELHCFEFHLQEQQEPNTKSQHFNQFIGGELNQKLISDIILWVVSCGLPSLNQIFRFA